MKELESHGYGFRLFCALYQWDDYVKDLSMANQEAEYMIQMRGINKGYMLGEEKVPVLKDIDFKVKKASMWQF